MIKFTAACAQFAITPMQPRENVQKAVHWIEHAVRETKARLVIVPETITTGFVPGIPAAELWDVVDTLPGALSKPIAEVAKKLGVYVVFPTYERGEERGVVYNSAALIDPRGEVIGVYRKTHLFPTERRSAGGWSTPGTKPVVVETELGNIGLTICYDGDFPELYRCEAIMGAEIICRPSALLRSFEIWEMTNKARAYDNHVYMLACNMVGPDAGQQLLLWPLDDRVAHRAGAGVGARHRRGHRRRSRSRSDQASHLRRADTDDFRSPARSQSGGLRKHPHPGTQPLRTGTTI